MRSKKSFLPGRLLATVLVLALVCTSIAPAALAAKKPSLSRKTATLVVGEKMTLKVRRNKGKVKWRSSNKKIVTVKNGRIKAGKRGNAKIYAFTSRKKLTCKVKVEQPVINKKAATLVAGKTLALKLKGTSQPVTWKSSNKKIATVTSKGVVTAKTAGTASVSAVVHGKAFPCKVKVEQPLMSKAAATLIVGKKLTLKLKGTSQPVTWKSSNTKVTTVTKKGVVTAKAAGTAKVTATVQGKAFVCKVKVEKPVLSKTAATLTVGKKITIQLKGTTQSVAWKSSNKKIATVTSKGVVSAKTAGTATVTATVQGKNYTCKVTVNPYISAKSLKMMINRSETLKIVGTTQTVKWKSSNASVATVSATGLVTSKVAGTTVITGTVLGKSYSCKVTVMATAESTAVSYEDKMIQLICDLSSYAKQKKSNFAMIPNGGYELYSPDTPVAKDKLLSSVDAVLIESVFYGWDDMDDETPSRATQAMLKALAYAKSKGKTGFNMEYCSERDTQYDAEQRSAQAGTVCFVATSRELNNTPALSSDRSNNKNCTKPSAAKNFLALLNAEDYNSKTQYLNAIKNSNYDLVFIDLYYDDKPLTKAEVTSLKKKKNGGTRMVCAYLSVGEAESYRDYWKPAWDDEDARPAWICEENEDWEGNYKVKYWSQTWKQILYGSSSSYLDRILNAGFDGAYLDVVDAYEYFATNQ